MRFAVASLAFVAGGCVAIAGLDGEYTLAPGATAETVSSSASSSATGGMPGVGGSHEGGMEIGGAAGAPGPVCGNGTPEPPEECDDGDTESFDGCSALCEIENPDSCRDAPVVSIGDGQMLVVSGDSTGAVDDVMTSTTTPECGAGTWYGPDHMWAVVPQVDGLLFVQVAPTFAEHFSHVRDECPGTIDLGCDYSSSAGTPDDFTVLVAMGQTYYVIVDSYGNVGGAYTVTLQLN